MASGRAIVCRAPNKDGGWNIENVRVRELRDGEVLVRMVASGICHTDIVFGDAPEDFGGWPRVMGHEGSGYVEKVGPGVKSVAVGDPVLLSFASCRKCKLCKDGYVSHCVDFDPLNFLGNKTFFSENEKGSDPDILGSFFGQSSFASLSICNESSVVNAKGRVKNEDELALFAPLGCGIQTGSGTILNVAKPGPEESVAIIGAGGVGLSAIMGAKIAGCKTIIMIDRVPQRLELSKKLGATHTIDTTSFGTDMSKLIKAVRDLTDGYGTTLTIDCTGVLPLIEAGVDFTARRGRYIQLGTSAPKNQLKINLQEFMCQGKQFIGSIEGQVIPQDYVPKMIEWWREGRFPFDSFTKMYKAEQLDDALKGMHDGSVIKPIMRW